MSFTRAQQPAFRLLVKAAWYAHIRENPGTCGAEHPARPHRPWYEAELFTATGQHSTKDLNAGRDYELAMAHFEALVGESLQWQMKAARGDARRILHALDQIREDHGIGEPYLRAVAARVIAKRWPHSEPPQLAELSLKELITVQGEVKRAVRRRPAAALVCADPDWGVA